MIRKQINRAFTVYFLVSLGIGVLVANWRLSLISTLASSDYIEMELLEKVTFSNSFLITAYAAFLLAILSTLNDVFVFKRIFKKRSLGKYLVLTTVFQLITIGVVILVMSRAIAFFILGDEEEYLYLIDRLPDKGHFVLLMFFMIALARFLLEVDRKLGYGNLWKMLSGRFYEPYKERRLFMFLDLKTSTAIAEKVGHYKFSQLIQDCFKDLYVIEEFGAEVYQYVGDEVVISWKAHFGLKKSNYIKAFKAFKKKLDQKGEEYEKKYGLRPVFKAGAHIGECTVAEVGELKREICYHGDTLNTSSRIQEMCNPLDSDFLISETLFQETEKNPDCEFEEKGEVSLKGKKTEVKLYKVNCL